MSYVCSIVQNLDTLRTWHDELARVAELPGAASGIVQHPDWIAFEVDSRRDGTAPYVVVVHDGHGRVAGYLPLLAIEVGIGQYHAPTLRGWAILAFTIIGPSILSQLAFMRAIELIGPGRAGVFVNLVPVFAPILAVLIVGEPFGLHHALALALVLGGIFIAERLGR